jgi:phage shock protein PspC (stress-responsive transcriptional regulator)
MTCTHCGHELDAATAYCPHCGSRVGASAPRLVRAPASGRIAGVCAGIAAYLDVDVGLIRILWIVFSIVPGGVIGGLVAYAAAWIIMPVPVSGEPVVRARLRRSATDRKIAGVCGGIAEYLSLDPTVVRVAWAVLSVVPGCIVLGLLAYVAAWLIMPDTASAAVVPAPRAA